MSKHLVLSHSERRTLQYVAAAEKPVTARQVFRYFKVTDSTAYKRLNRLANLGYVMKRPDGKWHVTATGIELIRTESRQYLDTATMWGRLAQELKNTADRAEERMRDSGRG